MSSPAIEVIKRRIEVLNCDRAANEQFIATYQDVIDNRRLDNTEIYKEIKELHKALELFQAAEDAKNAGDPA